MASTTALATSATTKLQDQSQHQQRKLDVSTCLQVLWSDSAGPGLQTYVGFLPTR